MIDIDEKLIKSIFPRRLQDSNKGLYGKVLNITGSRNYPGAGVLSALSALKVGAGYSILCTDKAVIDSCKCMSCDLIYKSHENFNIDIVKDLIESQKVSSIVYGCGIDVTNETVNFTEGLISYLKNTNIPAIIDADGLNCLAMHQTELNENFILTPHPKELSRLLQASCNDIQNEREKFLKAAYEKYRCVVLLKGFNTLITDGNNIYKNKTGSSALSKAGTGDVLAGMVGGFLAQRTTSINAAILSANIHGIAAEIYTRDYSEYSMLASDLFNYVPKAIKLVLN